MLKSVDQIIRRSGRGGPLSALALFPKKTYFEAQDPDEKIILLLRPHLVTNVKWILFASLMAFVPLFWNFLPVISLLPSNYHFVLTLFWLALTLTIVFESFLVWYFSVNIITDERVIDVDFYGLLFKQVDLAQINKIQDVNYTQKGILSALFNYGDVVIKTAADIPTFKFEHVPNPEGVMKVLSELIAQEEQEALEGRVR